MRTMGGSTPAVLILAAGQGKRMKSSLPKVLHRAAGQPLLFHILDRVLEVAPEAPVGIVVGHGREQVENSVQSEDKYRALNLTYIHQAEQKGTGHAARCALEAKWGEEVVQRRRNVLVLPGDLPLVTKELLLQLLEPLAARSAMRLLTCTLDDPFGYGRVVRKGARGSVLRIVEEKDTKPREKLIREVATSIYLFAPQFLRSGLSRLSNKNSQGEYYLTDLVAQAARSKLRIEDLKWAQTEDLRGVNDPWELSRAASLMNERIVREHALRGVCFIDAGSVWIDSQVKIGMGTQIEPGTYLQGRTVIAERVTIRAHSKVRDSSIGTGTEVKEGCVIVSSIVGEEAQVGPYAHLRPESSVGNKAKIGNFVELKKSRIGADSSVAHLSYLGDAEVGRGVNIGCGFVTCNFDGRTIEGSRKHKTIIEDDVFMGSDCQTVAPVRIGKGAFVASGSTITQEVPPESLAIARARQVIKPGYAKKLKDRG
jgi:bifunctional UDP-N-acetylglucosamine pyrophosphorylase/glucosamine-1-phosphate N-acetyltransferase